MQWKDHPLSIISYSRAKILSYLHINLGPYSQSTSCLASFPKASSLHHPRYNPTSAVRLWLSIDIFQRYIRITIFRAKFSCLWLMKAWCLCTSRGQQYLNTGSLNYHILQCSDFFHSNKEGKKHHLNLTQERQGYNSYCKEIQCVWWTENVIKEEQILVMIGQVSAGFTGTLSIIHSLFHIMKKVSCSVCKRGFHICI